MSKYRTGNPDRTLAGENRVKPTVVGDFAEAAHLHTGVYSPVAHDHDGAFAESGHLHTGTYAPNVHTHAGLLPADRIAAARVLGVPVIIDQSTSSASNTTLEETVGTITFAANFLGIDDAVEWVLRGWIRNNSGTARWLFPRLKWGGLQVHGDFTVNMTSSSTIWRPWKYEVFLQNMGSQSVNAVHGTFSLGAGGNATPGEGDFAAGNDYYTLVLPEDGVHRTVNTSLASTLAVTFQMQGAASTSLEWACDRAVAKLIPAI